jgi:hypothetical protein
MNVISENHNTGCYRLASKPLGRFLPVCPLNWWRRVSRFGPQNRLVRFGDMGLKITVTVS